MPIISTATLRRRPVLCALGLLVGSGMAAMLIIERSGGAASTVLFSVDEGTDLDKVFASSLQQAREELQVEHNGFQLNSPRKTRPNESLQVALQPGSKSVKEDRLVHAAADLEQAAVLEAAAGGVQTGVQSAVEKSEAAPVRAVSVQAPAVPAPNQESSTVVRPKPDPEAAALVLEAKSLLAEAEKGGPVEGGSSEQRDEAQLKEHGPMSGEDSREAINDFFDQNMNKIKASLPSTKEKGALASKDKQEKQAEAKKTMAEEAAVIARLEQQTQQYATANAAESQSADGTLKKALFGNGGLKAAAAALASQLMPPLQPRAAAPAANANAYANIYQAAAGPEEQVRALGVPLPTAVESSKLPGVNVAEWVDPRVTRQLETKEWRAAHPEHRDDSVEGYMDPEEGGSQLASFALPPPPKAAPPPPPAPVKKAGGCPPCGFLADCQLNPEARGKSRATGAYSMYPPRSHGKAWGSGGEHPSTLASPLTTLRSMGGVTQSKPLWNKLLPGSSGRRLLAGEEEDGEGGAMQELASFALPPPPKAAPAPPPKCVCPLCKLGDEKVGFADETHGKIELEDPDLLRAIDNELMRVDPHYAESRMDEGTRQYPVVKHGNLFEPSGRANPLSDFTDQDQRPWVNQVKKKNTVVW